MNETDPRMGEPRIAPVVPADGDSDLFADTLLIDGKPLNIFGTLAHHPSLMARFNRFAGYFLNKGLLPHREREIVILRVGWNCRSEYEFGQHTIIGTRHGLTADEVAALTQPVTAAPWSADDRLLIDLADDICRDDVVGNATWAGLGQRWNDSELIELVMVAGLYRMVSGFLNTMRVELDPGVPSWPPGWTASPDPAVRS